MGGRWEGKRGGDELSLGSHLALSCYFWGGTLSPLLDGGKSRGETLGRRENMASLGTRGKLVGAVLSEAEYISTTTVGTLLNWLCLELFKCVPNVPANSQQAANYPSSFIVTSPIIH